MSEDKVYDDQNMRRIDGAIDILVQKYRFEEVMGQLGLYLDTAVDEKIERAYQDMLDQLHSKEGLIEELDREKEELEREREIETKESQRQIAALEEQLAMAVKKIGELERRES